MYAEILEAFRKMCEHNYYCLWDDVEAIDEHYEKPIEEALKKQIPQRPSAIRLRGQLRPNYKMGDCPVCGRTVDSDEQYCATCGQKFDWEG